MVIVTRRGGVLQARHMPPPHGAALRHTGSPKAFAISPIHAKLFWAHIDREGDGSFIIKTFQNAWDWLCLATHLAL